MVSYFHRNHTKNKYQIVKNYSFLAFFFSTFCQPPVLRVVVTMDSWFPFVFIGESLSKSDPSDAWVCLLVDISISWDSCSYKGLLGSFSSFSVLFWACCTTFSGSYIVVSTFFSSSSKGDVYCHPFCFFSCFLFPLGVCFACGQALWRWPVCRLPQH